MVRQFAAALVIVLAGFAGAGVSGPGFAQDRVPPRSDTEMKLSFAPVAREAAPAVVNVYASRRVADNRSMLMDDPFFRQFFGRDLPQPRRERQQNSLGSGVIVDPSGLIVTNNHVIGEGTEVKVALNDRREYECDVILKDEQLDIAILKIRDGRGDFPSLPLGNSDDLQVGDLVLAIGNPFGVGQTVKIGRVHV